MSSWGSLTDSSCGVIRTSVRRAKNITLRETLKRRGMVHLVENRINTRKPFYSSPIYIYNHTIINTNTFTCRASTGVEYNIYPYRTLDCLLESRDPFRSQEYFKRKFTKLNSVTIKSARLLGQRAHAITSTET